MEIYIGIYIFSFQEGRATCLFQRLVLSRRWILWGRSVSGTTCYNSPGLHGGREFCCACTCIWKKTNKTKCIVILVAKILIAMVDFIVGRFVSSNWSHRLPVLERMKASRHDNLSVCMLNWNPLSSPQETSVPVNESRFFFNYISNFVVFVPVLLLASAEWSAFSGNEFL